MYSNSFNHLLRETSETMSCFLISKHLGILQKSQIHGSLSSIHSTNIIEHLVHVRQYSGDRDRHSPVSSELII